MTFDRALITGATSGIGLALARLLASKGIPLILTGRNEKVLEQLSKELGAQTIVADLGDLRERQRVIAAIHQLKPQLVINNAGLGIYGEAASLDIHKQMEILEVNVNALQELTLEALKSLKDAGKKGTIMNVSSAAAFQVFPYFAVYAASKTFVNYLSEALDYEMQPYGIRVLATCPGVIQTHFRTRAGGKEISEPKMTPEFAALEIWYQIKVGKAIHIFNWRYRLLIFLSRFIPKALLFKVLKKGIKSYIN